MVESSQQLFPVLSVQSGGQPAPCNENCLPAAIGSMAEAPISEPQRQCQFVWFAVPNTTTAPEPLLRLRVSNKPHHRIPAGNRFQSPKNAEEVALFGDPIVTSHIEP
jgi:hypothetical protein